MEFGGSSNSNVVCPRVFASPDRETKERKVIYDRSVYVVMEDPCPVGFTIDNVIRYDASNSLLKMKVWLKITDMPLHHYTFAKTKELVSSFGRLVDIDVGKADVNVASLDALIDCPDVDIIPPFVDYHFDRYLASKVVIGRDIDLDFDVYVSLGVDNPMLTFVEIRDRALHEFKARLLERRTIGSDNADV